MQIKKVLVFFALNDHLKEEMVRKEAEYMLFSTPYLKSFETRRIPEGVRFRCVLYSPQSQPLSHKTDLTNGWWTY